MNRVLAVRGQVLPATATPLTLHAELADGTVIDGQSRIANGSAIARAWVTPTDVRASEDALAAIAEAELIVLGPGSLYTSLLPSLLLPEIRDAVAASLCPPRLRLQRRHAAGRDDRLRPGRPRRGARRPRRIRDRRRRPRQQPLRRRVPSDYPAEPVRLRWPPSVAAPPRLVLDDVVDPDNGHHHDPARLAAAVAPPVRARERRRAGGRASPGRPERVTRAPNATSSPRSASELAAIDPARPCDRRAEAAGLASATPAREGPVARLAIRLGRGRARGRAAAADASADAAEPSSRPEPFDWDGGRRALPDGVAARAVPRPRLAEPGERPDAPRVRRRAGRGADARRAARATSGCRRRGGSGAAAAS